MILAAGEATRFGAVKVLAPLRGKALLQHVIDAAAEAELALDQDGNFLAMRAMNTSNLGASAISFVPLAKGIAVSSLR